MFGRPISRRRLDGHIMGLKKAYRVSVQKVFGAPKRVQLLARKFYIHGEARFESQICLHSLSSYLRLDTIKWNEL